MQGNESQHKGELKKQEEKIKPGLLWDHFEFSFRWTQTLFISIRKSVRISNTKWQVSLLWSQVVWVPFIHSICGVNHVPATAGHHLSLSSWPGELSFLVYRIECLGNPTRRRETREEDRSRGRGCGWSAVHPNQALVLHFVSKASAIACLYLVQFKKILGYSAFLL